MEHEMSDIPFSEIMTVRLLLRKLKHADWEMISYLRSDPVVNEFVKRPGAKSKEQAIKFISKTNAGINKGAIFYWAITRKEHDQMIGSICLWNFSKDRKTAEIGYDLSPEFQGKGVMSESLKSILRFGFGNLSLDLIEAFTHKENERSKKLLIRNHFKLVVNKRDDHNQDNLIYGIGKTGSSEL